MKPESIGNKYKAIEEIYGKEAKDFVKKLIEIFAKSRGQEAPLKYQLLDLYNTGEIVPYEEGQSTDGLQGKILLKHGEVEEKDYWGSKIISYGETFVWVYEEDVKSEPRKRNQS